MNTKSKSLMLFFGCLFLSLSAKAQQAENNGRIETGKVSIFQSWPEQLSLQESTVTQLFSAQTRDTVLLRFSDSLGIPAVKIMGGKDVAAFKLLWGIQPVLHVERSLKPGRAFNGFIMHRDAADSYSILADPSKLIFEKTGMERILLK